MPNGVKFSDVIFSDDILGPDPKASSSDLSSRYLAVTSPPRDVDSWTDHLPNFLKDAYNESVTGLAHTIMKGDKPFDLSGYDPNILEDIAAQIFSFVMPLDLATLGVGAKVGTTFAKPVVKKLMAAKVSPLSLIHI